MIQRIQSVYLFLAFVVTGVLTLFFPLWKNAEGLDYYAGQNTMYVLAFGISAALSVVSLLGYKKRQTQFVYNRLNIISNFKFALISPPSSIVIARHTFHSSIKGVSYNDLFIIWPNVL